MTATGREGMVLKPLDFISKGRRGFTQPAIKCRDPEYLRIIYGPEYLLAENLDRLKSRGLEPSDHSQAGSLKIIVVGCQPEGFNSVAIEDDLDRVANIRRAEP